ncbi:hypothetical protein [Mucilaginibacter agri]|uniref:Uncharacterized protein n=1 Tax=Mucilaginibacter agri TaxID=2695265 RepID=A0A966DWH3_9SPHI|nr:hypothetical protein [Mucilaginibacter agri]NCD72536.1 hypothetical protein [Mucilaginibacter agri]
MGKVYLAAQIPEFRAEHRMSKKNSTFSTEHHPTLPGCYEQEKFNFESVRIKGHATHFLPRLFFAKPSLYPETFSTFFCLYIISFAASLC